MEEGGVCKALRCDVGWVLDGVGNGAEDMGLVTGRVEIVTGWRCTRRPMALAKDELS